MDSSTAIKQQIKHGINAEREARDHHHPLDSSSSCYEVSGVESSSDQLPTGPLNDMSSLLQQLPIKRGLSKHYNGKSRSFASLSDVKCLEDLVKVEHPCNKKLKTCKSYAGLAERQRSSRPSLTSSSVVSKKLSKSKGSCSLLGAKRSDSFLGGRPPIPPHRSTGTSSISNQTALLA